MKLLNRKLLLILVLTLVAGDWSFAEKNVLSRKYDAKTSLSIDHLFNERVKSGFHPYRVTIRNGKATPITWTIRFDTSSSTYNYRSSYQVRVEPGAEAVEELLVPAPPSKGHRYSNYRNVRINASAPGLGNASRALSGSIDPNWPSIGISKSLAQRNLTRLANKRQEQRGGQDYFASSFNSLPTSWKGLTCLDILMIDEITWRSLPKQQKRAVMTWVQFGGRLEVFSRNNETTLDSLDFGKPSLRNSAKKGVYSLGRIEISSWNGSDLPDNLLNRYSKSRQFDDAYHKDFQRNWEMISAFGTKDFNPFLVFILLIIFAVLVGPVNLFHFAKAGQRHRLFVTTPLISLAASIIIILIILVQDGMGGKGRRIAWIDVQSSPDQRQLQIIQHQISRTGVMLRSGFENKEIPGVTPVILPSSRWNPINNGQIRNTKYQFQGANYLGDLFRSRSEQGFHIRSVKPTRSRIEKRKEATAETPPELFSSMEFPLSELHYVDTNGSVWKTGPDVTINPGQEITLQESNLNELKKWLQETGKTLGNSDKSRIANLVTNRGRFFALASNPESLMVQTHQAIEWNNDVAVVSGLAVEP